MFGSVSSYRVVVHEYRNAPGIRQRLVQQLEHLAFPSLGDEEGDAGDVSSGPRQTRDESQGDRVANGHQNRDRRGRNLDGEVRACAARNDQVRLPVDHVARDFGHPIVSAVSIVAFDDQIFTANVAEAVQLVEESARVRMLLAERDSVEDRHAVDPLRWLDTSRQGKRQHRTGGEREHFAPIHRGGPTHWQPTQILPAKPARAYVRRGCPNVGLSRARPTISTHQRLSSS